MTKLLPLHSLFLYFAAALLCWSLLQVCEGRVIEGVVRAGSPGWTFIGKFAFHRGSGQIIWGAGQESENFIQAPFEGGRILVHLDEDWDKIVPETSCGKKRNYSRSDWPMVNPNNAVQLPTDEDFSRYRFKGHEIFSQYVRPHFWYVSIINCPKDFEWTMTPAPWAEDIHYKLHFKQDGGSEFSEEEIGMLPMYTFVTLFFSIFTAFFFYRVKLHYEKHGSIFPVVRFLACAAALFFAHLMFEFTHLWFFSSNGYGIPIFEMLSELCHELSQLVITVELLLLSTGWTIVDHELPNTVAVVALFIGHIIMIFINKSYDNTHYKYHAWESFAGFLIAGFRVALFGWFANNLTAVLKRVTPVKRSFYMRFAFVSAIWFLSAPVLVIVASFCAEYVRHKIMTIGLLVLQGSAVALLTRLFFSRSSEYFKMSNMSDAVLPSNKRI